MSSESVLKSETIASVMNTVEEASMVRASAVGSDFLRLRRLRGCRSRRWRGASISTARRCAAVCGPSNVAALSACATHRYPVGRACRMGSRPRAAGPILRAGPLTQELRRSGYRGSYDTVKRLVAPLRAVRLQAERALTRFETPPGLQSQIDWGEARVYFGRGSREGAPVRAHAWLQPACLLCRLCQ
jgi:hypothetical protein